MNKKSISSLKMVATKHKNNVIIPCSTPEQAESPSRDSDSYCDSEAVSPVPFLCTQDGAEGETDVVWNFYTPKSENTANSHLRNSTPHSRKTRKPSKPKLIERQLPKRRPVKPSQKKTELFQELIELNQNLHELIAKKPKVDSTTENRKSNNDEYIFNDLPESPKDSPKSGLKTNSRCLRRNVLSSKFSKQEPENALESDDSMNECLLKASQAVENILEGEPTAPKRVCHEISKVNVNINPDFSFNINGDSIDAILNSIQIDSPLVSKAKQHESPCLNNDSFDCLVGNLNDSTFEQLTQIPIKNEPIKASAKKGADWNVQELIVHDGSPTSVFGRHNSMPESPTVSNINKPSTCGMAFGRYNSMPYASDKSNRISAPGDSPIRCSPDQIERKRQQAREKLIAKRLLPFTCSQNSSQTINSQLTQQSSVHAQATQQTTAKKPLFQPKVPTNASNKILNSFPTLSNAKTRERKTNKDSMDLKSLIEKKRQEALMKLRRRQPQNK